MLIRNPIEKTTHFTRLLQHPQSTLLTSARTGSSFHVHMSAAHTVSMSPLYKRHSVKQF